MSEEDTNRHSRESGNPVGAADAKSRAISTQPERARTRHSGGKWQRICALDEIPRLGARVISSNQGNIAIFRNANGEIFALSDRCPHKGGKLSQGIVFDGKVACPLHGWTICLNDGKAVAPDEGCVKNFAVKVEGGEVFLAL
jgi:nitrite reductase (NADH) small subunit